MMRKGMMLGSGRRGYYNVIGRDPYVHSQSARGMKQPQRMMPSYKLQAFPETKTPIRIGRVLDSAKNPKFNVYKYKSGLVIGGKCKHVFDDMVGYGIHCVKCGYQPPKEKKGRKSNVIELPIYKIDGKFYFRDERLGEYRNVKNPSDSLPIDSVPLSRLQNPTKDDQKKVFGGKLGDDAIYISDFNSHTLKKMADADSAGFQWHNKNKSGGNFGYNIFFNDTSNPNSREIYMFSGYYDTEGKIRNLRLSKGFGAGVPIAPENYHRIPKILSMLKERAFQKDAPIPVGGKVPFPHDDIGVFNLPDENAIYVPSTDKSQKRISEPQFRKRVKETEDKLSELFEGFTRFEDYGGFKDEKTGDVIRENGAKVVSFASKKDAKNPEKLAELRDWMIEKQKDWGQKSIGYEHEGDLHYLWAKKKPEAHHK